MFSLYTQLEGTHLTGYETYLFCLFCCVIQAKHGTKIEYEELNMEECEIYEQS